MSWLCARTDTQGIVSFMTEFGHDLRMLYEQTLEHTVDFLSIIIGQQSGLTESMEDNMQSYPCQPKGDPDIDSVKTSDPRFPESMYR